MADTVWYHSLPLPHGIVTPGSFDNLDELRKVPFPKSLDGRRCLDVATADGFWAFEMERRGAAEVVAIDVDPKQLDWPAGAIASGDGGDGELVPTRGFQVAHRALRSKVAWRELSVYQLDPGDIGMFDFIFMGSALCHLRDPVGALSAIRRVLRGDLLSVDVVSLPLTLAHPWRPAATLEAEDWPLWWVPNVCAYRRLFSAAGLRIADQGRPFFLKHGSAYCAAYGTASGAGGRRGPISRLKRIVNRRLGNPHAWVQAEPRPFFTERSRSAS